MSNYESLIPFANAIIETSYPLYFNLAESTYSIVVDTKLSGIENYHECKWEIEINICTKRKLGMLTGLVKKPTNNPLREAAWETCNSLLISWILHNVETKIKKYVMYSKTLKDMWDYLKRQFYVSNGARKFRLNKERDDLEQGEKTICEGFLDAQHKEQEERKRFKFFNGLNTSYATMRSNVLIMAHLPIVEEAQLLSFNKKKHREEITRPV
ncbi:uncharacterized protein LOC141628894 [Silene latifolia]|uniref:uncharacterized protein LOC141628894 n=1 Tax=Silene latifolia TaxID=37657 RepID=UPI003D78961B